MGIPQGSERFLESTLRKNLSFGLKYREILNDLNEFSIIQSVHHHGDLRAEMCVFYHQEICTKLIDRHVLGRIIEKHSADHFQISSGKGAGALLGFWAIRFG